MISVFRVFSDFLLTTDSTDNTDGGFTLKHLRNQWFLALFGAFEKPPLTEGSI
jgi:hypothetical protein